MPSRLVWLIAAVLLAGAATAYGGEAKAQQVSSRFIFWHLTPAEGATPEQVSAAEKAVRTFFETQRGRLLMDGLTMDSLLLVEGNEKYLRCGTGPACLAGLGEAAGVPRVITGEVSVQGGRTRVRLVLVDVNKQKVVIQTFVENAGVPSKTQLEELSLAMFEPEHYRGGIELSCAVAGATVLFDGEKVGVTPLVGPLGNLPAGPHRIEVKKDGHQTFSRDIQVPVGSTRTLVALLPEQAFLKKEGPVPFQKSWIFWTAAGIGVASLATAVVLHLNANVLQDNASQEKAKNLQSWHDSQSKADGFYRGAYITYGIGGAALIGAGVVLILDLAGRGHAPGPEGVQVGIAPSTSGLAIAATWHF